MPTKYQLSSTSSSSPISKLSLQLRWDRQFEQKNLISNGIFRIVSCMFPQTIVGCSKHLYLIFVVRKILCLMLTLIWILDTWNQLVFFWRYGVDERLREFIYMTSPGSPSLLSTVLLSYCILYIVIQNRSFLSQPLIISCLTWFPRCISVTFSTMKW